MATMKASRTSRATRPNSGAERNGPPPAKRFQESTRWEARVCELELRLTQLEKENNRLQAALQELEAASAYRASLKDFAPVGLLTLDPHGIVLEINRTAATLLRAGNSQLLQRDFTFLTATDDVRKFRAHLRYGQEKRRMVTTELALHPVHGQPLLVQLASVP